MLPTAIFVVCLILLINKIRNNFNFWKQRKVPFVKPLPLIGNCGDLLFFKCSASDWMINMCKKFNDVPIFGVWIFTEPCLVIQDYELIKKTVMQNSSIFIDRGLHSSTRADPLVSQGLMFLSQPVWKRMKNKLSPRFTPSKARSYFDLIGDKAKNLTNYVNEQVNTNSNNNLNKKESNGALKENTPILNKDLRILDIHELAKCYSMDCITSIFFGLDINSYSKEDPIRNFGMEMYQNTFSQMFNQGLYFLNGSLVELLKVPFTPRYISEGLKKYLKLSLKERKKSGAARKIDTSNILKFWSRGDFVDFLLSCERDVNEDLLLAQPISFFVAGLVTSGAAISFALLELGCNLSEQNEARKEIKECLAKYGWSYEGLQAMKYLDAVITETMRKYPAVPFLDRRTVADYQFPGVDLQNVSKNNVKPQFIGEEKSFEHETTFVKGGFVTKNNFLEKNNSQEADDSCEENNSVEENSSSIQDSLSSTTHILNNERFPRENCFSKTHSYSNDCQILEKNSYTKEIQLTKRDNFPEEMNSLEAEDYLKGNLYNRDSYKLPKEGFTLRKGSKVLIPVMGLHYNPEYFPEPEKFDPGRFLGKRNNKVEAAMPYGFGPRLCLGKQFGHLIVKIALARLLSEFEFDRCPKTVYPVVFEKKTIFVESQDNILMYVKKI